MSESESSGQQSSDALSEQDIANTPYSDGEVSSSSSSSSVSNQTPAILRPPEKMKYGALGEPSLLNLRYMIAHILTRPLIIAMQLCVMLYKSMLQWLSSIVSISVKNIIVPFGLIALISVGIRRAISDNAFVGDIGLTGGAFPRCTTTQDETCVSLVVVVSATAYALYGHTILNNFAMNNGLTVASMPWIPGFTSVTDDIMWTTDVSLINDWLPSHLNVTPAVVVIDEVDPTDQLITYQAFVNTTGIQSISNQVLRYTNNVQGPLVLEMSRALAEYYVEHSLPRYDVNFIRQDVDAADVNLEDEVMAAVNATFMPMLCFAVLGFSFIGILNDLVFERANYIKQSLTLLGLKDTVYWLHKYISQVISAFVIITCFYFADDLLETKIIPNASYPAVLVCFGTFMLAFDGQAHFLSVFINREKTSAMVAFGCYIMQLIGIFLFGMIMTLGIPFIFPEVIIIVWMLVFPDMALANILFIMQRAYSGLTFTKFTLSEMTTTPIPAEGEGYSARHSVTILVAAAVLYHVVAWYLYHVFPPGDESRKPWYFPVAPSWLFDIRSGTKIITDQSHIVASDIDADIQNEVDLALTSDAGLRIMKLSKTFKGGFGRSNRALDDLCLSAETKTCLVLLGHNGAGKSTCVNMLDGLTQPTSGDALMYGKSIVSEPESIRRMIGVVQQHDMTFKGVSGLQHVILAGLLQRTPHVYRRAREVIDLVGLTKARNRDASNYSGGMKRRLMLAMAMVHNPRILFVDEVTSGMDPLNRRNVWAILKDIKAQGRIVVLTTHSMEEADMLGDKVAILANGRLRAVGSVLDLKQRFGSGYKISLIPKARTLISSENRTAIEGVFARELAARPVAGAGITFAIPNAVPAEVSEFLKSLEASIRGTGPDSETMDSISSYNISHSSLGEVFMSVTTGKGRQTNQTEIKNAVRLADGRYQINLTMTGSSVDLGFVTVAPSDTLADVRQKLKSDLPGLALGDDDFIFNVNGSPVDHEQETAVTAVSVGTVLTLDSRKAWIQRMAALFSRMLDTEDDSDAE
ncbi:ABC transporter [Carpediemonas membranifera]|uniref:ABC transporter n=1 Tax=Carpediemonas membranifera TaxID=201153 RepID=A0A8J6BC16_9EUKA|nr:ABC transporter [Carpediemonas membranifera]|eukprot:KAG9397664.1 ABC transporter [Carpediemonas membranifera]